MTVILLILNVLITAFTSQGLEGKVIPMAGFILLLSMGLLIHATALPKGMSLETQVGPALASRVVHGEPQGFLLHLLKGSKVSSVHPRNCGKQVSVTQRECLIGH